MKTRPRQSETLFVDARGLGFLEQRTVRALGADDIAKIAGTYHAWRSTSDQTGVAYEDVLGFCRSVATEEIVANGYVLTPGRYVGSEETGDDGEPMDAKIARLGAEVRNGFAKRAQLQEKVLAAIDSLVVGNE